MSKSFFTILIQYHFSYVYIYMYVYVTITPKNKVLWSSFQLIQALITFERKVVKLFCKMLHIVKMLLHLKIIICSNSATVQNLPTIKKDARSTLHCFCRAIYLDVTKLLQHVTFYGTSFSIFYQINLFWSFCIQ